MSVVPLRRPSIPYANMTPYDDWWHVPILEEEKTRILSLSPLALPDGRHVMRWRHKQVWYITKRIEWLNRIRTKNVNVNVNTGENNV